MSGSEPGAPPGRSSLPLGLKLAVNRLAPALRFATPLRVTAKRPTGGPPLPGGSLGPAAPKPTEKGVTVMWSIDMRTAANKPAALVFVFDEKHVLRWTGPTLIGALRCLAEWGQEVVEMDVDSAIFFFGPREAD